MKAWPYIPGVPAAGHVTSSGYWHPGRIEGCVKCKPYEPRKRETVRPRDKRKEGENAR